MIGESEKLREAKVNEKGDTRDTHPLIHTHVDTHTHTHIHTHTHTYTHTHTHTHIHIHIHTHTHTHTHTHLNKLTSSTCHANIAFQLPTYMYGDVTPGMEEGRRERRLSK